MSSLKGKTLFISGASRGIGLAIALRAAHDGANVAIAAKTAEPHPKLKGTIFTAADEVRAAGGKALPVICDIRDEVQVIAAVDKTVAEFGGIDICVNNASAISLTNSQATDMKRFDLMMGINEVRHEHVRAGTIGRAEECGRRGKRAVAAHYDRYRRGRQSPGGRCHDAREPHARDHGRRGLCHPHKAVARVHRAVLYR